MIRPDGTPFEYISFAAAEREYHNLLPADTPEECKRTVRLLTGDLSVESKGRRATFYRAEEPTFIFPVQKLEEHGLVCRTDPIMRDLEHDRDLSPEDYGLEPMPA